MFLLIIAFLAIVSILLALLELRKQSKLDEVHKVRRELQRKKVLFYKDSSK